MMPIVFSRQNREHVPFAFSDALQRTPARACEQKRCKGLRCNSAGEAAEDESDARTAFNSANWNCDYRGITSRA